MLIRRNYWNRVRKQIFNAITCVSFYVVDEYLGVVRAGFCVLKLLAVGTGLEEQLCVVLVDFYPTFLSVSDHHCTRPAFLRRELWS